MGPDDAYEEGVVGEFEVTLAVGLDGEQAEPALHGALGDAGLLGHGAHGPMGGTIGRFGLECGVDDLGDAFIVMGPRPGRAQLIVQPLDPLHAVALSPLADGGIAHPHTPGDRGIRLAPGTGGDDLRTLNQSLGQRAGVDEAEELGFFVIREDDRFRGATAGNGQAPGRELPINLSLISGTRQ